MKYYKTIIDGYIVSISTGNGQTEISKDEYDSLMTVILSSPSAPNGFTYLLRANTLEWELAELPPEPTDPDLDDSEALDILLGGGAE